MADARYDQGVRREKDLLPYAVELLPEDEFGDLQFDGDLIFGSGDSGDVTLVSNTTLTEDVYYNNLTVNSGVTLNPSGFRIFVKNTLTLNGDIGIKEAHSAVTTGSLEGTVGVGQDVVDGLGGAGEPDGHVPGYTFTGSGSVNTSVGVTAPDFYDLRDAINAYKQRGSDFIRVKGGAGGGTGADGVSGAGSTGSWPPNASTVGAPGGRGSAGTGGSGGTGGRGGGVVMVSARVISGSGGLYAEGGPGVAGLAGTDGTPAPTYIDPATNNVVPGNHHHEESGPTGGAHHTNSHTGVSPTPATEVPGHANQHTGLSPTPPGTVAGHANQHTGLSPTPPTPVDPLPGAPVANPSPGNVNEAFGFHHDNPPNPTVPDSNQHTTGNPPHHTPVPGNQNPPVHNYPGPGGHHAGNHNPTNHTMQPGTHHHTTGPSPGNPTAPTVIQVPSFTNPTVAGSEHNPGPPVPQPPQPNPPETNTEYGPPNPPVPVPNPPETNTEYGPPNPPTHQPNPPNVNTETGPPTTNPPHTNHHTVTNPTTGGHTAAQPYAGGAGGTGYTGQRGGRGGGGVLIVVTRKAGTPSYSMNTGVNGTLIALDTANI